MTVCVCVYVNVRAFDELLVQKITCQTISKVFFPVCKRTSLFGSFVINFQKHEEFFFMHQVFD